jgi:hypothetical protein
MGLAYDKAWIIRVLLLTLAQPAMANSPAVVDDSAA